MGGGGGWGGRASSFLFFWLGGGEGEGEAVFFFSLPEFLGGRSVLVPRTFFLAGVMLFKWETPFACLFKVGQDGSEVARDVSCDVSSVSLKGGTFFPFLLVLKENSNETNNVWGPSF